MNASRMVHLVFPEKRVVTGYTVLGWHDDAFANGELPVQHGGDLTVAIRDLEDLGHITTDGRLS